MSDRLVAGGEVSKVDPETTGLHPAWRAAGAFTVFGAMWEDSASAQDIARHRQHVAESMVALRGLAPESGAYFNEVGVLRAAAPMATDVRDDRRPCLSQSRNVRSLGSTIRG